jgi:pyroglutamyl-peptidase
MKLLVTGFPKFDAFAENSTQALIESMRSDPPAELDEVRDRVLFEILPFENDDPAAQQRTMVESFRRAIATHGPDVCLFCGQAASRPLIELEAIAVNVFKNSVIDPEGPPAYWATLPGLKELVGSLRAAEIPAQISYHAGTHLCNHILYTALHLAATSRSGMRCGFMHLPMTSAQVIAGDENRPFIPLSVTRRALTMAIRHVFEHSER